MSAQDVVAGTSEKPERLGINANSEQDIPHKEEQEVQDQQPAEGNPDSQDGANKKKKKKKKKSKANKDQELIKPIMEQTDPPTIPITKLYPNTKYPVGQLMDYQNDNKQRVTGEERRAVDMNELSNRVTDLRRAAEVHRQVRKYAQSIIKPGVDLTNIAEKIENGTRTLVEAKGHKAGIGFPTGLSLNHCAAHYTPNAGDKVTVKEDDVLKIDIGVHVNGRIVDSAFTMAWNSKYDKLLEAVKDATNTGIREAGIDVRLSDVGAAIEEVMESYEVELNGKVYPVKSVRNLCGHNIKDYIIHGGKSVPIVKSTDHKRMEEGELFAIETFGTTGRGVVVDEGVCSHYSLNWDHDAATLNKLVNGCKVTKAKSLYNTIQNNFGTIPFCRRYLDRLGETKYLLGLKDLVNNGVVTEHPPLYDVRGSYVAQFEHTLILRPNVKEVLSRGDDY